MTRTGKIGRLPKCTRDELGSRIEDGEPGQELVKWLNGLSGVQRVLKEQFGGRLITEQNLSEWRQTGHAEWLRQEETRLLASQLTEQSDELDEAADGDPISDRFAGLLAAEMARLATALLEKETDPEKRWQRFCQVHRELSQLRRDDHRAVRTRIKRERWNRRVEREDEETEKRLEAERREHVCAPLWAKLRLGSMAEVFGGGEMGLDIAAFILEVQNGLPMGKLGRRNGMEQPKPCPGEANPTESNLIQPNPTNLQNGQASEPSEEADSTTPDQTQSR